MKAKIGRFLFYTAIHLFAMIYTNDSFAQITEATISPTQPVMKESFFLELKLALTGDEEPYVSFDAQGCEVLGRENAGEQVSTVIINGRISTSRSSIVRFEISCMQQGMFRIADIQAEIGGKKYTHAPIQFRVTSKPVAPDEVFVESTIDKGEVFVGEGIDLNYYLYRRVSVHANEIKQFPKLNGFIKRFHMPNSNPERVQYGNNMYIRLLIYSAKIFPESAGEHKIDPIKVQVQYASDNYMSPFGAFGMGRIKTKVASSQPHSIKVLPLPTPPKDGFFTGLVGEHEFQFQVPRNRVLANETIEAKLVVKGEGALENMEAPSFYAHDSIERFNVKSNFEEIDHKLARKTFDFTLIGRSQLEIPGETIRMYTFSSIKKIYEFVDLAIPTLVVADAGQAAQTNSNSNQKRSESPPNSETRQKNENIIILPIDYKLLAPDFRQSAFISWKWDFPRHLFAIALLLPLLLQLSVLLRYCLRPKEIKDFARVFYARRIDYKRAYHVLNNLSLDRRDGNYIGPVDFIRNTPISAEAKSYFLNIINIAEQAEYNLGSRSEIKPEKRNIRELEKYVERNLHRV